MDSGVPEAFPDGEPGPPAGGPPEPARWPAEPTTEPTTELPTDRHADPTDELPAELLAELADAGVACQSDPAVLAAVTTDWTGRWSGPARGLVRPGSTAAVAAVLRSARRAGVPVQVQGGNTGLVGGSVPAPDRPALVLSTTGLRDLGPVDPLERTVAVGAGVTCAELAAHARAAGLRFGVDLAARDSATVGGMAATNAGGLGVVAFGMMRSQVRGLTAVLADGRIVDRVGRPAKDNTGHDLSGLLVGSEGTLGVITAVEVVLHAAPPASSVGLLATPDLAAAAGAARAVQEAGGHLLAAEVVDRSGVGRAAQALGIADPLAGDPGEAAAGWLLLLEVADGGTGEGLVPVAEEVVAFATDAPDRARLWALREQQSELYAASGVAPVKLDVSVRIGLLDDLVDGVRALVEACRPGTGRGGAAPPPAAGFFGHVLDGNLHVQLVGVPDRLTGQVLALVAALGGSISAEHGIGRMKAGLLDLAHTPDEIAWMRSLKATVDPDGLLNSGVLLP